MVPAVMLAFAIRRAIWAFPTLFGVSLVVFVLTTLLPEPVLGPAGATDVEAQLEYEEGRRARFLDLPRFFNPRPEDVESRADACVAEIAAAGPRAELCERRLAELGGAALPFLVPKLDGLASAPRARVALALAPVARRMGAPGERDYTDPARAALFWQRFWDDRSVDFTEPAVRRTVERLVLRGTELRERDLELVDTYALGQIVGAMRRTQDPEAIERLTRLASHVTGRDAVARADDPPLVRRAMVSRWLSYWFVHSTDHEALEGGKRVTASLTETRYAKWMVGAVTGQLGLSSRDGVPILDKLAARAPVTLGMTLLALFASLLLSVPVAMLAAWQRGETLDHAIALGLILLYSVPTVLVAELLAYLQGTGTGSLALPVLALTTVPFSILGQQQRAAMMDALDHDYVRSARAKGARTLRVAAVHALRNALVPTTALAGVQLPALLGAAFVVEEVFGIHGLGWETLRAIEARDVAWVVAVTLAYAMATTAALVASDVVYGLLDPRVRETHVRVT